MLTREKSDQQVAKGAATRFKYTVPQTWPTTCSLGICQDEEFEHSIHGDTWWEEPIGQGSHRKRYHDKPTYHDKTRRWAEDRIIWVVERVRFLSFNPLVFRIDIAFLGQTL